MKLRVIGLSIVAISSCSSAFLLFAAPPTAERGLRVDITNPADRSLQFWGSQVPYAVSASYDGKSTKFGELASNDVVLRATYVGDVDTPSARRTTALPDPLVQISQSNCTGCHDFSASSSGPSFASVSNRYGGRANAGAVLASHIRNGSKGAWGGGSMPPHPEISPAQANAIAQWILALGNDPEVHYSIGKSGSFRMSAVGKPAVHSGLVLSAFYTGPLKPGDTRTAAGRNVVIVRGSGT